MQFYRKFIETLDAYDWQIDTDDGWKDIECIGKTVEYDEWILKTENFELICADTHIIFDSDFKEVFVKDLKVGNFIQTKNGLESVIQVEKTDNKSNMYDLQLSDDSEHRFYTSGILSHNSMWLHNIAVNIANQGKNVAVLTLEMAKHKVMKRVGSMRLKIPVTEYEERSKDQVFMKNRINSLKNPNGGIFSANPGKIFVKKFNTSMCTITDIDNYIKKFEEVKKLKLDVLCLDYINLMAIEKGLEFNSAMLYLKGKHLAEGLRYIADKYNIAVITATQTDKAVWGANDIRLNDIPESKAIAETADCVIGIIRNPEMKRNNLYRLKILKLRDGENKEEQIKFDFNTTFLTMENDQMYGAK